MLNLYRIILLGLLISGISACQTTDEYHTTRMIGGVNLCGFETGATYSPYNVKVDTQYSFFRLGLPFWHDFRSHCDGLAYSIFWDAGASVNGVQGSVFCMTDVMHGASFALIATQVENGAGFVAAPITSVGNFSGLQFGGWNMAQQVPFRGYSTVQIGAFNVAESSKVQVGLLNFTESKNTVQIGLWNQNKKWGFPFINLNLFD